MSRDIHTPRFTFRGLSLEQLVRHREFFQFKFFQRFVMMHRFITHWFCTVRCFSFWRCTIYAARRKLGTSRWKPTSQPCEDSLVLRKYFAALLSVCEISQTPFSPAKWFLKPPDICYRHWEIFSIRFLLSKSQNTPCKPPITRFLSF